MEESFIEFNRPLFFMKKYWHLFALLLIIIFVVYVRSQALSTPIVEDWSEMTINNYLMNQFRVQVDSQHPNLPAQNKDALVNDLYTNFKKDRGNELLMQKQALTAEYRKVLTYEFEGKEYTYMGDIDSYYWLRFAENIVDHGDICDEWRGDKCYDNLALAPLGRPDSPNLHPYMISWVYKISNFIGYKIPLMQAAIITPTIVAILVAIAAFFAGFVIIGKLSGLITSALISFNMMYIRRSLGSDNDIYNLLFPMIVLAFLFLAIKADTQWKKGVFALLAGLFTGLFKFAWQVGWWNIFNAVLYSFIIYIGFLILYDRFKTGDFKRIFRSRHFASIIIVLVVFYMGSLGGYALVGTVTEAPMIQFWEAPLGPISFAKYSKSAVNYNIWPNVKTTVAEFGTIRLDQVPVQLFGSQGKIFYAIGILGIFLFFIKQIIARKTAIPLLIMALLLSVFLASSYAMGKWPTIFYLLFLAFASFIYLGYIILMKMDLSRKKKLNLLLGIIVTVWFLGTLYATSQGIRFVMLLVPPAALAIGIAIQITCDWIIDYCKQHYDRKVIIGIYAVLGIVILFIPVTVAMDSLKVTKAYVPNYNDAWAFALTNIRNDSNPNATTGSWWDSCHTFKWYTKTGTFLDGATQNAPPLHWLGKILLTDNEDEAAGILRMLGCGSNLAYEKVFNITHDGPVSVDILYDLFTLNRTEAIFLLADKAFTEQQINEVLEYTHCNAPDNYFIASNDLVGKAGVWAHFGSWDFYKSEVAAYQLVGRSRDDIIENITSRSTRSEGGYPNPAEYYDKIKHMNQNDVNAWIAPWPSFGGESGCQRQTNTTRFICTDGFIFDEATKDCYMETPQGRMYPKKCAYDVPGDVELRHYNESLIPMAGNKFAGVSFIKTGNNTMRSMMSDYQLVGSMFSRMYFYNGLGLKHFQYFDFQQSPFGDRIYVYKLKHEKNN